jgi:hypothetical protein
MNLLLHKVVKMLFIYSFYRLYDKFTDFRAFVNYSKSLLILTKRES